MKRPFTHFSIAAALFLAGALAPSPLVAQDKKPEEQKGQPAQDEVRDVEEVTAYMAWYGASKAGDTAKALVAAKDYLAKYPSGQNAEFVKKWLDGQKWGGFNEAVKKKDMAEVVRIGREHQSEDASFAYWTAWYLRQNELLTAGEPAHAKEAEEFTRAALEFVEKGGVATGIEAAKFDKSANLAWLHQNLALLAAKSGKPEEALEHYDKSSQLAPADAAIMARNQLGCGSLHKELYDQAVTKYKTLAGAAAAASPSPEAQAAIDTANKHADAAIECWAKFLGGSSGSPALRQKIEAAIGALWTYRHPDQPDGWKALVQKTGA